MLCLDQLKVVPAGVKKPIVVCAIGGTDPDELRQYVLEDAPDIVCATR